ncbi:MAG TPA: phosphatase domain-containing protein [Candidatus Dormibacteraeota bacterium]|jgi:phosphatidate phosphatase APP1
MIRTHLEPPGASGAPSSSRPHRAARLEDVVNRRIAHWLWARGWRTRIVPYTGYGGSGWVRVMARTVLARPRDDERDLTGLEPEAGLEPETEGRPDERRPQDERQLQDQRRRSVRGWRRLATAQVKGAVVEVRAGDRVRHVMSDRGGYIDAVVEADLEPGWHDVELALPTGSTTARVFVIGPDVTCGIVSDIDDTIMVTAAPRTLLAIWNTFVLRENARRPVPGMAQLYQRLLRDEPQAPVLYLSTGPWNAAPTLGHFLRRHGFPAGAMLLTDWGPTNSGWFRGGAQHKRENLRRLMLEFPNIRWLLIGDDGQRDPEIYAELAAERPERVRGVAIRQLTATQQTLAHGAPTPPPDARGSRKRTVEAGVPFVAGPDGARLDQALRDARVDLT